MDRKNILSRLFYPRQIPKRLFYTPTVLYIYSVLPGTVLPYWFDKKSKFFTFHTNYLPCLWQHCQTRTLLQRTCHQLRSVGSRPGFGKSFRHFREASLSMGGR